MALRCCVFRGLVKEAEEDINKFLTTHEVRVLHMAQSESGEFISVTLIVDEPEPLPEHGL
jgi:hypothetical protein